jgi:hypothetical protein
MSAALGVAVRVVPESARLLLRTAQRAFDWAVEEQAPPPALLGKFLDLVQPLGFRMNPADEEIYPGGTDELVRNALDTGVNAVSPPSWGVVRGILRRTGDGGLVVVLPEGRPAEVMQPAGPDTSRIVFAPDGPQLLHAPGMPVSEPVPGRLMAFDKCGSVLSAVDGPARRMVSDN